MFRAIEGHLNFVTRIGLDGQHRQHLSEINAIDLFGTSPDGQWVTFAGRSESNRIAIMTLPVDGGAPSVLCNDACRPTWSPDVTALFLQMGTESPIGPWWCRCHRGASYPEFSGGTADAVTASAENARHPGHQSPHIDSRGRRIKLRHDQERRTLESLPRAAVAVAPGCPDRSSARLEDDVGRQADAREAAHHRRRGLGFGIFRLEADLHEVVERGVDRRIDERGVVHHRAVLAPRRPHVDEHGLAFALRGGEAVGERGVPAVLGQAGGGRRRRRGVTEGRDRFEP